MKSKEPNVYFGHPSKFWKVCINSPFAYGRSELTAQFENHQGQEGDTRDTLAYIWYDAPAYSTSLPLYDNYET